MRGVFTVVLWLLALLMSAACEEPAAPNLDTADWPEPLEGGAVLRWRARTPGGGYSFETDRAGESVYHRRRDNVLVERTLDDAAMTQLRDDLLERNCCNLQGPWRDDVEWLIDWRIRMPGLSCDIVMPAAFFDHDHLAFNECERRLADEWAHRPRVPAPAPNSTAWPAVTAPPPSGRLPPEEQPEDG